MLIKRCVRINEASEATMRQLKSSNIMPESADLTVEAWIERIDGWGKLNFFYMEPCSKLKSAFGSRRRITKGEFLKKLINQDLCRLFGTWTAYKKDFNKMYSERTFVDLDGKGKVERLFVEIDLKPELKKAIKK